MSIYFFALISRNKELTLKAKGWLSHINRKSIGVIRAAVWELELDLEF